MKLAVLTSGLFSYTGGPPVVIANLLNQLNKFDEIELKYFGIKGDVHSEILKLKSRIQYEDFKAITPYRISFNYLKKLIKYSPNTVWVHGMWLWPNFIGIMYAFITSKNLILTPHGVLTNQMFGVRWYKKLLFGLLDLAVLILKKRVVIHYLSDSESKHCILNQFNLKNRIIPNIIEVNLLDKLKPKKQFIYLARIAPIKGIEDLLKINNLKCDIFGFGDQKYIDKILGNNFNYKGTVKNSEVGKLFSEYTFYILPSYGEGLPTSAIEAAMAGCILLVSNQCNLNMFINNIHAIKYDAGIKNLQNAIDIAKNMSDTEIKEMRSNSLGVVNKYFSLSSLVPKYKELILDETVLQ